MRMPPEVMDHLRPDIARVIDLALGAFAGQDIPNGAIIIGLGAVIGLTLNEDMPGVDRPEAPEMGELLPYLQAGMAFGRDMKIGRLQ